jgi:hypothetical protein
VSRARDVGGVALRGQSLCAFGAGASVAAMMLTTEAIIREIPEPKAAAPAGPGMGGMEDMT